MSKQSLMILQVVEFVLIITKKEKKFDYTILNLLSI